MISKIWVVCELSGFLSESTTSLFHKKEDALKVFNSAKEILLDCIDEEQAKCNPSGLVMTNNSVWVSGEIVADGVDGYITIEQKEVI